MYKSQTLREIIRTIENDIALELNLQELPIIGEERAIAFAVGAAKRDIHDHITWLAQQIVPSAESDEQTIIDAANYEGVPRKQATKATGIARISAPASVASQFIDVTFQHQNGQRFTVLDSQALTENTIQLSIKAESAGSAGNLADEALEISLISPINGSAPTAIITKISGGADTESISELLGRLYFRKQNPPMGGAEHDYVAWATEVGEVTRAWAYSGYHGGATVGLTFVCDNLANIIPTETKMNEVDSYIFQHIDPSTGNLVGRPGGIEVIMFKLSLKQVQLEIKLTPDTETTRKNVLTQLKALERLYSKPNSTILLSQVRTAIGNASGVEDYICSLSDNITSSEKELITFEDPVWLT
ncbi:baseplate J/gp47 family protein [Vibrio ruber]|uniref:baseplate J/gp47 family protein n=1 Tax=Vibrio ruber TaxID=184755 RepID=UPI002893215C|nr:baseplate J/gp47 family protein [Vibrio ruber]WNJ96531.1 baseplate J/gp47 family protein [Vibrio ruber]